MAHSEDAANPETKHKPKYEALERLMICFDFTPEDIVANAQGHFSQRQRQHLQFQQRQRLTFVISLSVAVLIGHLIRLPSVISLVLSFGLYILGGSVLMQWFKQRIDFDNEPVIETEGRIELFLNTRPYRLFIDQLDFPLTQWQFLALKNYDPYRIYWIPKTRKILSVEWLRDNPLDEETSS